MSTLLNKTAATISAATPTIWGKPNDVGMKQAISKGKMYTFVPSVITNVEDSDLALLEKIPLIKRGLDCGDIVTGKVAKKVSENAEKELKSREEKEAKNKG